MACNTIKGPIQPFVRQCWLDGHAAEPKSKWESIFNRATAITLFVVSIIAINENISPLTLLSINGSIAALKIIQTLTNSQTSRNYKFIHIFIQISLAALNVLALKDFISVNTVGIIYQIGLSSLIALKTIVACPDCVARGCCTTGCCTVTGALLCWDQNPPDWVEELE